VNLDTRAACTFPNVILHWLDLVGTLAFAISGAFRAVKYELDLLGVLVLAAATGVGGGILRDVLLGRHPPGALMDGAYLVACAIGGLAVFFFARKIVARWDVVLWADAAGLGLFTALGAAVAEASGANRLTIVLMASLTACGGGVLRDVLVGEIPAVLTREVYATASLLGGGVYVALSALSAPEDLRLAGAAVIAWGIRMSAMRRGLSLPRVQRLPESPSRLSARMRRRR